MSIAHLMDRPIIRMIARHLLSKGLDELQAYTDTQKQMIHDWIFKAVPGKWLDEVIWKSVEDLLPVAFDEARKMLQEQKDSKNKLGAVSVPGETPLPLPPPGPVVDPADPNDPWHDGSNRGPVQRLIDRIRARHKQHWENNH